MGTCDLSHDALMMQKAAQSGRAKYNLAEARMKRGPYLEGGVIVIPSDWYNRDIAAYWKGMGARWAPKHTGGPSWVLWGKDEVFPQIVEQFFSLWGIEKEA